MDLKKAYYYIICLAAIFSLFWGGVDLASSAIGLTGIRASSLGASAPFPAAAVDSQSDQLMDTYYQKKMLFDRLTDSLARLVIAGAVFAYCRRKVDRLEKEKRA